MAEVLGADPDALDDLAAHLSRRASAVEDRRGELTGMLASVDWEGPDAEWFRRDWREDKARALDRLVEDLRTMATHLRRQADDQRRTSRGGAGAGPGRRAPVGSSAALRPPPPLDLLSRPPGVDDRAAVSGIDRVAGVGATSGRVPLRSLAMDTPVPAAAPTAGGTSPVDGPVRPMRDLLDDAVPARPTAPDDWGRR